MESFDKTISIFEEATRKYRALPIIQFETNLVNHCNLNCKSCDHMSPIAEEWYADVIQFQADIGRIAEIFNQEARYIRLVGGEPLLHPELPSFLKISRMYFPWTNIEIWTNGLLLDKMKDSFWRSCSENRIVIIVTKYPISLNYEKMYNLARNRGVNLRFFGDGITVDGFNNNSFDLKGSCEPRKSHFYCPNANRHITLMQGGNLYPCDKVSHTEHLNSFFGTKLPVSNRDYINIYSDVTADQILTFLSKTIPFCRFCNLEQRMQEQSWDYSKRVLSEWAIISNDS